MSNVVDSKVVDLELNNRDFETNADKSISTLDRLKKAFKFEDASKNFDEMNNAIGKVNLGALTSGVYTLRDSLNSLKDIVVFSWLADEAIKAKNAVEGFVKSLTIDQATAGWSKYADKTSAVQTIMAATAKDFSDQGEQMEYVNGQLEKLNWFTDETSYSFLDMVGNIGKFTSNNVKLDAAVTSMQGISNWAAISGANVNEASRAMYNLSQAISVGAVKLIDWKSIENANMATAEFKQTAIDTAVALGTLKEKGDGVYETLKGHDVSVTNFNSALSDAWFTSDVLLQTLDNYGEFTNRLYSVMEAIDYSVTASQMLDYVDKFKNGSLDLNAAAKETGISINELKSYLSDLSSEEMEFGLKAFKAAQEAKTFEEAINATKDAVSTGWMNTFEIMFGDYLQAKTLWTDLANDLYDIFAEGGNARNALLKEAFGHQAEINESDWAKIESSGLASPKYISEVRRNAREHGVYVDMMADDETWLQTVLSRGLLTMNDLEEAKKRVYGSALSSDVNQSILKEAKAAEESNESFQKYLETIKKFGAEDSSKIVFGDGQTQVEELESALDGMLETLGLTQDQGEEFIAVLKEMGYLGGTVTDDLTKMTDEQLKNLGLTDENIRKVHQLAEEGRTVSEIWDEIQGEHKTGGELWIESLHNAMDGLMNIIETVKESFHDIFPETTSGTIFNFLEWLNNLTANFKEATENSETFKSVLHGIFSVLDLVLRTLGAIGQIAKNAFTTILDALGIDLGDVAAKVGDALTKFREWTIENETFSKGVTFVSNAIATVVGKIKSLVQAFLNIPIVSKGLKAFGDGFKSAFQSMPAFLQELGPRFQNFMTRVKALDGLSLDNIRKAFDIFKEEILDFAFNFEGFDKLKDAFGKTFDKIGEWIRGAIEDIKNKVKTALTDWRGSMDDNSLAARIYDFVVSAVNKAKAMLGNIVTNGDKGIFKKVFDVVISGLTGIWDFIKKIPWGTVGGVGLAITPIIIVISVVKKIAGLFLGFGKILNNLTTITDTIRDKLQGKTSVLSKITDVLKSIALVVAVFAIALYALSSLPEDQLANGLMAVGGIAGIVLAMIALIAIIDKLSGGIRKGTMGTVAAIAAAIWLVSRSVIKLAKIPEDDLANGITAIFAIAGIIVAMQAVMAIIDKLSGDFGVSDNSKNILATAVALWIMGQTLAKLSKIPADNLANAAIAMAIMAGILAIMQVVLGAVTKLGGGVKGERIIGLIATAAALWVMAKTLNDLAKIPADNLANAAIAMAIMAGILAIMQVVLGAVTKLGGGVEAEQIISLVATAAALWIMAQTLSDLGNIPADNLTNAMLAIAIMGGILAIMQVVLGAITMMGGGIEVEQIAAMVATAASLWIMAKALADIGNIPSENIENATMAMTAMAGMLAIIQVVLGIIGIIGGGVELEQIAGLIATAAALWIMAKAMVELGNIPIANLETAMIAMGELAAILAVLMIVGSLAGSVSPTLLVLAAVIAVMGIVFHKIAELPTDQVSTTGEALMKVMLSLAALLFVMGTVGGAASAAIPAMAQLLILFGIAAVVFGAVGALASLIPEDVRGPILSGCDFLVDVAGKLGEAIGSFVGGAFEGAISHLPAIGDSIAAFMDSLRGVKPVGLDGIASFSEALIAIGSISVVGFADSMLSIVNEISSGRSNAEVFASELTQLADSLVHWQEAMNQIDSIDIPADAITSLTDLIKDINMEGFWSSVGDWISSGLTGETSMEQFASDTAALANVLKEWQTSMNEIGSITFDGEAINGLIDTIKAIPTKSLFSTIKSFFTGAPDFESFKTSVTQLGEALVAFGGAVGEDFDIESVKTMADAVSSLAGIGKQLKGVKLEEYGLIFKKDGVFKNLADGIKDFVANMQDFSVGDIDLSSLSTLSTAVSTLAGLNFEGDITQVEMIEKFKTGLEKLVAAINATAEIDTSGVSKLTGAMEELGGANYSDALSKLSEASDANSMNGSGKKLGSALATGISGASGEMTGAVTGLVDSARDAVDSGSFGLKGQEIVTALASGIQANVGLVTSAIQSVMDAAKSAADGYGGSMYGVGMDFVNGFARGLNDGAFRVRIAAAALARAALDAARAALNSNSPSKEAFAIGEDFDAGFVGGIDDGTREAYLSGYALANAARKGLSRATALIKDAISSDINTEPVIRPVLDLTEIQTGVSGLSSLFGPVPVGVYGQLGAISGNVNGRVITTNADVVNAIGQLRKQLNNQNGGDTYVVNGITYDDGSNIAGAVRSLIREARVQRRA